MRKVYKSYLSRISKIVFSALILSLLTTNVFADIFDWTGAFNTDATNALNWQNENIFGLHFVPIAGDDVQVGIANTFVYSNLNVTASTTWKSLTVGFTYGYNSATTGYLNPNPVTGTTNTAFTSSIIVNSGVTLTVSGNITINNYASATSSTNNFVNVTFSGAGTVLCQSNFLVGDASTQPALTVADVTKFSAQVNQLTISGNLVLNSNGNTILTAPNRGICYPWFSVEKGITTLLKQVVFATNNAPFADAVDSYNPPLTTYPGYGKFTADNTTASASTLELKYKTPIVPADKFYVYLTYGGNNGTVLYDDPTVENQTIYTANEPSVTTSASYINSTNPNATTSYYNLTFSGASTKVVDQNSTITGATPQGLTVGGTWATSGGAVNLNTNSPTVTVTGGWTNSAVVTQNLGNISVTGPVANTGTLTLGSGNFTMNGNYTNSGSGIYTQSTGTTFFSGNVAQSLIDNTTAGTQFNKVSFTSNTLANAKAMSGTGGFAVSSTGILTIVGATTTLDAGGVLTFRSASTSSAAVDIIPTGSVIKGLVYAERFLNGGGTLTNRGYRLLSSPVNQTSFATSASNTYGLFYLNTSHSYGGNTSVGAYTAGPGGSGFSTSNNNATIYLYDESQIYNGRSFTLGNHVPVNAIAATTETVGAASGKTIPIGNGFLMYFVGATGRANATTAILPTDATLTANGYINQGTFIVKLWTTGAATLSYTTPDANHPYPGLNMVGNPYPSTIDLNLVLNQNLTQINSIYVLSARNSPNQKYIAFTPNGTSAPSAGYAVSGEGFFVTAKTTGNTLTFNESQKVPASQLSGSALIMSTPNTQAKTLSGKLPNSQNSLAAAVPQGDALTGLYMKIERDSTTYDYCGIYFRKDWSATFAEDDAKDMNGTTGPVVMSSLSSDNIRASVNHMPDYTKGVNVKLYANARADGQYKLKIEDIRNIDTLYDIYLIDHYKKDSLDIRRYGTYLFDISKADTSSYGGSRFELSVRPRPLPVYRLLNFTAQKVTGGVQVSWKTEAESNYTGFVLQKQDGTTFNPLYSKQGDGGGIYTFIDPSPVTGANTYRLQQDNIVGAISLSPAITIIYNPAGQVGLMNVYPNPTKATISVNVSSMTSAAPTYKANIYNSAGQLMMQRSVSSNSWTEDVTQYTPGTYIIQLKDNSGNLIGKSKFVKTN
ncbi:T9SS type A sorting domain-containing protein [Mucilaginibacter sp. OK098]|uniref:T9SS type A sorting domain-containing protein n=1 Tax=Mucilaginibacter sp. OK098 TaxID=1855297 RepID=UPI000922C99A|nr:T9SS type A sorting domain-containing protein [Mucilaginibacter sp. OK098]SHN37242.1 hypothetical protein SAMN05216524_11511 [Mucilaginibacter sp. OK098]